MNLQAIVEQNTRQDDFVNATNLCKYVGKEWKNFYKLKETKTYVKALVNRIQIESNDKVTLDNVLESRRGKGGETWVHPLLAIKLAEWLSPEFELYVKQTFKRYLDADESLAKDIMARSRGKAARCEFTEELKRRGVTSYGY